MAAFDFSVSDNQPTKGGGKIRKAFYLSKSVFLGNKKGRDF